MKFPGAPWLVAALLLALVLGIAAGRYFGKPDGLEVALEDIPEQGYLLLPYEGETFLVFRIPESVLVSQNLDQVLRLPKVQRVEDPHVRRGQLGPYRVFSLRQHMGVLMFPDWRWWNYTVPCSGLMVSYDAFEHQHEQYDSGIHCARSASDWWHKHLVFDLNGMSRSSQIADLAVPRYRLADGMLIIADH